MDAMLLIGGNWRKTNLSSPFENERKLGEMPDFATGLFL